MHAKVKICGLTRPEEAEYLNENRADYAGFVLFFPKSRRNISLKQAREIQACLDPSIRKVAVTVSPTRDQIQEIEQSGFDVIQIHGEFSPERLGELSLPVFRALNAGNLAEYERWRSAPGVAGCLFDAARPGSGQTFDWTRLLHLPRPNGLLLLAGGLTPENVGEAVRLVRPDVVDVSSGVEYGDGRPGKDPEKVSRFIAAVRES